MSLSILNNPKLVAGRICSEQPPRVRLKAVTQSCTHAATAQVSNESGQYHGASLHPSSQICSGDKGSTTTP